MNCDSDMEPDALQLELEMMLMEVSALRERFKNISETAQLSEADFALHLWNMLQLQLLKEVQIVTNDAD